MSEETIDIEVHLGKETADKINKQTKQELINWLCLEIVRNRSMIDTIDTSDARIRDLELKLSAEKSKVYMLKSMMKNAMDAL